MKGEWRSGHLSGTMARMWWRRGLWLLLGVAVVWGVWTVREHTQADPQCDVGFTCANVDKVTWTGTDPAVGGLCVKVTLSGDVTTMFSQTEKWGFRRANSQRSTFQPQSASVHITKTCTDPEPGVFKDAWLDYVIATDKSALETGNTEAARALASPTKATVVRGKDRNWLFTVVKVPSDTGAVDDAFGSEFALATPKHWSQELGELRLPCVWVSARGSVIVEETALPFEPRGSVGPIKVCPSGHEDMWYDKVDSFFRD